MPNFSLPDSVFTRAAEQFPTPFHLYDEQGIRENARLLNKAFAWCPSFREYFAVKALPNPAILRILKEEGFDGYIDSEYEGQRHQQDRGEKFLPDEVEEVRRHHEMLNRLINA